MVPTDQKLVFSGTRFLNVPKTLKSRLGVRDFWPQTGTLYL